MGRVISKFTSLSRKNDRYDWDKWFDGRIWSLVHGEDFTAKIPAFRSCAYLAAKRMGVSVEIHETQDGVELQSSKKS